MTDPAIKEALLEELERLPVESQKRILDFAQSMERLPRGTPLKDLISKHAGTISKEDAQKMLEAIEEGCGQVDLDEW